MRKFIAVVSAILIGVFGIVPAQASNTNTVVIIDSGFNLSNISNNVIQEVCITSLNKCNNGTGFEIGQGASQTTVSLLPKFVSDWNHGTNMALATISANPNVRLILIRNASVYSNGNVVYGGQASLEASLQWVLDNKNEYSIGAVLMSRGSHSHLIANSSVRGLIIQAQIYSTQLEKMGDRAIFSASIRKFTKNLNDVRAKLSSLPDISCPATATLSSLVTQLKNSNVASVFATGNDYNNRHVDNPACLDDSIAVTASDSAGNILQKSNVAPNTDFAINAPNTSTAAALLTGKWSLIYNGSYDQAYASLLGSGASSNYWSTVFIP